MNVKTKSVYYCEFCKKHGLSRPAMEKHERRCTMNPDRRCGWCEYADTDLPALVLELRARGGDAAHASPEIVEWLRGQVDGCPACMLAAFRQAGLVYHWASDGTRVWDFGEQVELFRKTEREGDQMREAYG
ncbi:MAG: hypothetical protein ACJ79H_03510 [Myxococcales bacterium]